MSTSDLPAIAAAPYPRPIIRHGFDKRFDMRSFGEPLRRLRAVRIVDNGEPLADLREVCPELICRPGSLPLLRATVAAMVACVQRRLPEGHTLIIGTGMRTIANQQGIREHLTKGLQEKHPEWTAATLQRMANRMVAPIDALSPPPHTTGGAVDIGVRGPDGEDLKFSDVDDWWSVAPTYSHKLGENARKNRLMLIEAMEGAGLTNYLGEWWHWSYGDQGWALRVGSPVAFYGLVEVPNAEELRVPKPPEEQKPDEAKDDSAAAKDDAESAKA
jgi:D-alanyl-D-alanine dipeptidase